MGLETLVSNVEEQIKFSVLMSVYGKEEAEFLNESLNSIFTQTYPAEQVVLVCDGELTDDLEEVIDRYKEQYFDVLQLVRKDKNEGLGLALREGLQYCRNEWVARMDADDIALPNRFEEQFAYLKEHPEVDVLGSSIIEFNALEGDSCYQRLLPEEHQDIIQFAKRRNPFNHGTMVFRKSKVLAVGSYVDVLYFEDYHLIIRLIQGNAILHNLTKPLLRFRFNDNTLSRRSGFFYFKKEYAFMKECRRLNFLSNGEFFVNTSIRFILRILPAGILSSFYRKKLRNLVK